MTVFEHGEGSNQNTPHQILNPRGRDNHNDAGDTNKYGNNDPLALHVSDHSALILVAELLDESNYVTWNQSMLIALNTRDKLGFILREVPEPMPDSTSFCQWHRVNSMLISWILNSMTKKLSRGFMFSKSVVTLWKVIKQRFGQSNGVLINQLRRDMISVRQGTNSVAAYFHEFNGYWDEFESVRPRRFCNCCHCGVVRTVLEQDQDDKLHQFIIGLNTEYAAICNQILVMDPVPSRDKAYTMVSQAEKHNNVHGNYQDIQRDSVMPVRNVVPQDIQSESDMAARSYRASSSSSRPTYRPQRDSSAALVPRDGLLRRPVRRPELKCAHCGDIGHLKETCFKLHGFPDWWEGSRDTTVRNKFLSTQHAHAVNTYEDSPIDSNNNNGGNLQEMIANLQLQVDRLMKGKGKMEYGQSSSSAPEAISFSHYHDFAGPQD